MAIARIMRMWFNVPQDKRARIIMVITGFLDLGLICLVILIATGYAILAARQHEASFRHLQPLNIQASKTTSNLSGLREFSRDRQCDSME